MDKVYAWLKVAAAAVTGLQSYLHFVPFLPSWIAPTLAAVLIVVDDGQTILASFGAAPQATPPAAPSGK